MKQFDSETSLRRNQVNFLVYGQEGKKKNRVGRSVGRQNKNNII